MTAVLFCLRAAARARWRSWLGFALAAGLVGGATIAALAGARRTETSYARFLDATRAFDVALANGGTTSTNLDRQFDLDAIAAHPDVVDAAVVEFYFPSGTLPSGRPIRSSDVIPWASPDGRFGTALNEARALRGRLPERERELALSFLVAERFDLDVGDTLSLGLAGTEVAEPPAPFTVVGVVAIQGGFPPITGGIPPVLLLAPSYTESHPDGVGGLVVRLRDGLDGAGAFQAELRRMAAGEQVVTMGRDELTSPVQRGLDTQATGLRLIGALVSGVAVAFLAQAFSRQRHAEARDDAILRALGSTDGERRAVAALSSLGIALVATLVAVVTAIVLSPLAPIGVGRYAEPDPGAQVDLAHLVPGAVAVLLAVVVLGQRRPAHGRSGAPTGSRVAALLARLGAPPVPVSGVRLALEAGAGRASVPVRSTLVGGALGVAAITAVISFAASLDRLFDEPELYGWTWDVQIGDAFSPGREEEAERLAADPAVAAVAQGSTDRFDIAGRTIDVLAIEPVAGVIAPTVVAGKAPTGPDELLLGGRTMRAIGVGLGDEVDVASGTRIRRMRVVGQGVLTEFAGGARLGEGAAMTLDGMRRLVPDAAADVVLVRVQPGAAGAALRERLVRSATGNVYLPEQPPDLAQLERVGSLPSVAAALLGVTALGTVAHALLAARMRRARELAILKAIGFRRSQVAGTIAWQAAAIAVVALVVGLPAGLAAGRWSWERFAGWLGAPPDSVVPIGAVGALGAAVLVPVLAMAALPAWLAAATPPAPALRADP